MPLTARGYGGDEETRRRGLHPNHRPQPDPRRKGVGLVMMAAGRLALLHLPRTNKGSIVEMNPGEDQMWRRRGAKGWHPIQPPSLSRLRSFCAGRGEVRGRWRLPVLEYKEIEPVPKLPALLHLHTLLYIQSPGILSVQKPHLSTPCQTVHLPPTMKYTAVLLGFAAAAAAQSACNSVAAAVPSCAVSTYSILQSLRTDLPA